MDKTGFALEKALIFYLMEQLKAIYEVTSEDARLLY